MLDLVCAKGILTNRGDTRPLLPQQIAPLLRPRKPLTLVLDPRDPFAGGAQMSGVSPKSLGSHIAECRGGALFSGGEKN